MRSIFIACLGLFFAVYSSGQPAFTVQPSLTKDAQNRYWVEFEISQNTDVAVSIVDVRDSSVVRHLAAGMLGASAPAPLTAGTLHQRIEWDGRDNLGAVAAHPESLSVRVRAGMGARLLNIVGDNVYAFNCSFGGIVPGRDGSLFILGSAGYGNCYVFYLRQYDASGNYLRTVFPPAAGLPADSVTAYGINVLPGAGWAPKTTFIPSPLIANTFINSGTTKLLPIGKPGELTLVNGTDMQTISESGAFTNSAVKKIITGPAAPPYPLTGPWGPKYFTASHSPDYLYLSGWYYGTVDGGTWLVNACDTGFWADGQVFKVNRATGVVSPWIRLDSIPVSSAERMARLGGGANATATLHGVAIDDSGHVFVCDRLHKRISVYDTNAVLVGSVPCNNPDFVAVSKRTGAIYVITRMDVWNTGPMNLVKFNGWKNPAPAAATTLLTTTIQTHTGAPCMVVTEDGNSTIIWAGYYSFGVREYRDDGASFTLLRDFSQGSGNLIYDRIAADPKSNTVFVTNSYSLAYKIEDWGNPAFVQCSTTLNRPLYAADFCVAQSGLLYIRADLRDNNAGNGSFDGPIARYTLDHRHAPVNYANTGGNISTPWLGGRYGKGWGDKGFAVSPKGIIGSLLMDGWNLYHYRTFPDTGYADTAFKGTTLVTPTGAQCGGVKFDLDGNAYMGLHVWASDRLIPDGFASDWGYSMGGAVVRFAPGATGAVSGATVTGADKIYPQSYGAFSADGGSSCVCRSPRFDLDPYGRLFMPHGATAQVTIADNAGNTILTFGQYGNTDSRGGLSGPGTPSAEPAIPLAWPIAVAATEDYVYVNDWVNERLARVQMTYVLDNIPGLTENPEGAEKAAAWKGLSMASSPNPFTPSSAIRVAMPASGKLQLSVYDMKGRLVRTLSDRQVGPGVHTFAWRGNDASGRPVSAGIYVYRLCAGKRVLIQKAVLAK